MSPKDEALIRYLESGSVSPSSEFANSVIPQGAGDDPRYVPQPQPAQQGGYGLPSHMDNAAMLADALTAGGVSAYQQGVGPLEHFGNTIDNTLQTGATLLSEFSGVPNMMRGGQAVQEGLGSGNNVQVAGGAAQAGLSAVPVVGPLSRAAFATAPRAMGTMGAMGAAPAFASGMFGGSSEAQAQGTDPLEALYAQQRSLTSALEEARRIATEEGRTGRGPKYDAAMSRVGQLEGQMSQLSQRIANQEQRNTPEAIAEREREQRAAEANTGFRERMPGVTALLPAIGLGIAGGLPFLGKALKNANTWMPYSDASRLGRATNLTDEAIKNRDVMQASLGARTIDNQIDQIAKQPPKTIVSETGKALAAGGSGGMLMAEASMFPDQYDAAMLPQGSPEQKAALDRSTDINKFLEKAAGGVLTGVSGYKMGGLLTDPFGRSPNIAQARATSDIAKSGFPGTAAGVKKSFAATDGNAAANDGSGKASKPKKQNNLAKASKRNITDAFQRSDGKLSMEEAAKYAPGVTKQKLAKYLNELKAQRSDKI